MANNDAARVPVLMGTNHDEFTLFVALQYLRDGKRYIAEDYPRLLRDTFGANAAAVGERYPLSSYGNNVYSGYSAAVTDGVFACVGERMSDDLARVGSVYAYEFNDPDAPAPESMHTLPYPAQQTLSDQMIDYWSRFVASGSPHAAGQPDWPALSPGGTNQPWMSLQPDGSRIITDFGETHQCSFWANLPA
jgi:para-nitrobenzyl esterase